ncbi:MAG TPA: hypothetical protein VHG09_03265 [Longimicrobiales bacterium]|nr:hypothetical protein [Longimicrobiales bacterium]
MDGLLQIAALVAVLCGPADQVRVSHVPNVAAAPGATVVSAVSLSSVAGAHTAAPSNRGAAFSQPARMPAGVAQPLRLHQAPVDSWLSEDKFRHAAASWAAMVFTYAATSAFTDNDDTALAVAVPVTAAFGIAKEVVDRRRGGPFSFRDLTADAIGAAAAWFFLREMH